MLHPVGLRHPVFVFVAVFTVFTANFKWILDPIKRRKTRNQFVPKVSQHLQDRSGGTSFMPMNCGL